MPLAKIHAVWIGNHLGRVHAACLRSFVLHGHSVTLHVYQTPNDVPSGVQLADANKLLPESEVVAHSKTGNLAIFSDFLRYEVLAQGLGLYVDCDVYCVRPIEDDEYILSWETYNSINGAVLKLPVECPVLAELRALRGKKRFLPPWFRGDRRAYYAFLQLLGLKRRLQDLPWGSVGPHALTWYMNQYDLLTKVRPCDVFYPNSVSQFSLLFDNGVDMKDIVTPRTLAVHLWYSMWGSSSQVSKHILPIDVDAGIVGKIARSSDSGDAR